MKRYLLTTGIFIATCSFIYLSGIYLVRAELSFKQLSQKAAEMEEDMPVKTVEAMKRPVTSGKEILPETVSPPKAKAHPLISMEFENANLKDVLKIFCQQSGLNFIAGQNAELKPVTLYLNNVSVKDALNSIIKANGLTYEQAEGSNVFIVTNSAQPEIKLKTKIFKLKHAFAEDKTVTGVDNSEKTIKGIKGALEKLLTPNGDISVDPRTNSIIITDIPERFELIKDAVSKLDAQLPQVLIEAKIVEISSTDLDQLGIKWTSLAGYTLGLHNPTRTYSSSRTGGEDRTDQYTTTTLDSAEHDIVSSISGGTTTETMTYDNDSAKARSLTDTFTRTLTKGDLRSAVLSADNFDITLSLLLTDTDIDIISSPNIVTAHSKEAKITVGEQYPIPQFTYNSDTAAFEVEGFEYKDIGIILRVTPYADMDKGSITLELNPEVSSIERTVLFKGVEIPVISTRMAVTNVSINDGDTLAIGGLLRNMDNTTVTKVPLLGDIPVLGHLFRHKEASKGKTNLIIFITPHILRGDNSHPATAGREAVVSLPSTRIKNQ